MFLLFFKQIAWYLNIIYLSKKYIVLTIGCNLQNTHHLVGRWGELNLRFREHEKHYQIERDSSLWLRVAHITEFRKIFYICHMHFKSRWLWETYHIHIRFRIHNCLLPSRCLGMQGPKGHTEHQTQEPHFHSAQNSLLLFVQISLHIIMLID